MAEMDKIVLTLDPGEKGIVGNMVVENSNDSTIELSVRGDGPVLRDKMMIKAEQATSPALKIYYMVMNMYLDPASFDTNYKPFLGLSRELVFEVPSTGMIMADIGEALIGGEYREAFEKCFELMEYEALLEQAAMEKKQGDKAANENSDGDGAGD